MSEYRKKLVEAVDAVKIEIVRLKENVKPVKPDNAIGRLTRMEAINAKSIAEANLRSAENRLSKMEAILEKFEEDGGEGIGLCVECGDEIPIKRLLVRPESTRCVYCLEERV